MSAKFPESTCARLALLPGAITALMISAPAPAAAREDDRPPEPPQALIVTIGAGAKAYPRFPGATDLGIHRMLIFSGRREGQPVPLKAPDQNFGLRLFGAKSAVKSGLAMKINRRRRERDVGAAVGNVGWTIEAGAFAESFVSKKLRVRTEVRKGVNGHKGLVGEVSADYFIRDGKLSTFSIGPRMRWADSRYNDAYFGVSPEVAARTGLAAQNAGSGLQSVGAAAGMRLDVGRGVAVHAYALHDRLLNDAARSPIISRFGSRNQFGAGLGLSYSFRVPLRPCAVPSDSAAKKSACSRAEAPRGVE